MPRPRLTGDSSIQVLIANCEPARVRKQFAAISDSLGKTLRVVKLVVRFQHGLVTKRNVRGGCRYVTEVYTSKGNTPISFHNDLKLT